MKGNKARGLDGIVIEMIKALDDFGIEKLTIMANEIYDTGKTPQNLSKSIFSMHYQRNQVQSNVNFIAQ